jgi:hypothetical protein
VNVFAATAVRYWLFGFFRFLTHALNIGFIPAAANGLKV